MIAEDGPKKTLPCKPTLKRYHKLLCNAPHSDLIYDRISKLLDEIKTRAAKGKVPPALVVVHRFDLYEEPGIERNKDALNLCCRLRQVLKDGHVREVINALDYLLQLRDGKKIESTTRKTPKLVHPIACSPKTIIKYRAELYAMPNLPAILSQLEQLRQGLIKRKEGFEKCKSYYFQERVRISSVLTVPKQLDRIFDSMAAGFMLPGIYGYTPDRALHTLNYILDPEEFQEQISRKPKGKSKPKAVKSETAENFLAFKRYAAGKSLFRLVTQDDALSSCGVFKGDTLGCEDRKVKDGDMVLMNLDDELIIGHISLSYATPERFTIKPLIEGERIILPSQLLSNVLAVVISIGLSQMATDGYAAAFTFQSPMPKVTGVGMVRGL